MSCDFEKQLLDCRTADAKVVIVLKKNMKTTILRNTTAVLTDPASNPGAKINSKAFGKQKQNVITSDAAVRKIISS